MKKILSLLLIVGLSLFGATDYIEWKGQKIITTGSESAGHVLKSALTDGSGNPLSSHYNTSTGEYVLNIHDAHVHDSVINRYARQDTNISTTLATAVDGNGTTYQIDVTDATGFANGDYIYINTSSIETTLPRIISSTPALPTTGAATFTLDRRLDKAHEVGDTVVKNIIDMASQAGTIASPQEYYIAPPPGEVWHVTRLIFSMVHGTAGDLGLFGNLTALTNGVLLRVKINGEYTTLTNWKINSDIKSDMYDVDFDPRSGGGGSYGTSGRGTFLNVGAVVRLDGDTNDKIEFYIQDDITSINLFTMKFQGHRERF